MLSSRGTAPALADLERRQPQWPRWRAYDYEELVNRDKASLDIFWLKDESLADSENLPDPGVIALEIVQDLEAALEQFREIAEDLSDNETDAPSGA